MKIKENISSLKSQFPDNVTLVAVSKTKPVSDILQAYETGHRDFGENRVQDMATKYQEMPKDINWHMIGHLQRNKVKYMAEFVYLIHSVDSFKLLKEIDKQAKSYNRTIDCLLQIKIAKEDSKFGMHEDDAVELIKSEKFAKLENIAIKGVMGMATFTEDKNIVRSEFKRLKEVSTRLKDLESIRCQFNIISMGMSGDYSIAIEEGSNMIRVGSKIFGSRN